MLNFCELDWENSCKEFHKNKRVVHTASSTQEKFTMEVQKNGEL